MYVCVLSVLLISINEFGRRFNISRFAKSEGCSLAPHQVL